MTIKSRRFSSTTVVAYVALFAAVGGGTGYAASQLPNDSVGSKQIKRAGVAKSDIRGNAIDSARVQNGTLLPQDFRGGVLPQGPKGDTGAKGDQGPKGDQGVQGIQGPAGVVGAVSIARIDEPLLDGNSNTVDVTCPAGTKAIGGGATVLASGSDDVHLTVSRPHSSTPPQMPEDGGTFDGWRATYDNPAGGTGDTEMRAFAICAQIPA